MNEGDAVGLLCDILRERTQSLDVKGLLHLRPTDPEGFSDLEDSIELEYVQQGSTQHFLWVTCKHQFTRPGRIRYDTRTGEFDVRTPTPKNAPRMLQDAYSQIYRATSILYEDINRVNKNL